MNGEMTALEKGATKKRINHPERVTLTPESAERIDQWNDQLSPKLSGRRLPRAEFVNWLITKHPRDLDDEDIASLHSEHFDPIKALEWAVRKVKEAQANGESVNIHKFVDQTMLGKTGIIRKPRKSRINNDNKTQF
ncbi:MAG: hypothetical protein NTV34_14985 [Proteobacteria bacterium]|nr:hypothetical protein [Pseudomonadota bacterium]